MKRKLQIAILFLACGTLIFSGSGAIAKDNGKGKGNKHYEYPAANGQGNKNKGNKGNKGKGHYKGHTFSHATPHTVNVPPGHYPPAGYYRIWYAGRPPGQQPAPVPYGAPANAPITPDAFILYGDRAYDTQYDWRQAEVQKKKTVPREIIDILFPNGVTPPAQ